MRVAVFQHDPVVRELIERVLASSGYFCTVYRDNLGISKALTRSTVDLLVLDWQGTRPFGAELLHSVRKAAGERVPIMFVSRDASEQSMVRALVDGADDYVTLPLRPEEFRARVAALVRRVYPERRRAAASFERGPYRFDTVGKQVMLRGKRVPLSPTQFDLAALFFSSVGWVMSRDHIYAIVWGRELNDLTRTIDSHVSRLRQLLEIERRNGFSLQPVYRSGYRLMGVREEVASVEVAGEVARTAAFALALVEAV
ncbi:response regulator transcription factor [Paraburkholderia sp. Ac-20342]|uniref:response regulator transcription factor n=1 Tax=Paraburkholderia sp. Ac-20342 TaxID=2703889 RepID=UPI00198198C2|nr:response regulator transcription factor [Paraburkholderia sp. Ac-20342]MBN3847426.1 response regulator transcription factor [Paraburkholderia sp. Ac-20342]